MKIKFFLISLFIVSSCAKQIQTPQSIHQIQNNRELEKTKINLTSIIGVSEKQAWKNTCGKYIHIWFYKD